MLAPHCNLKLKIKKYYKKNCLSGKKIKFRVFRSETSTGKLSRSQPMRMIRSIYVNLRVELLSSRAKNCQLFLEIKINKQYRKIS